MMRPWTALAAVCAAAACAGAPDDTPTPTDGDPAVRALEATLDDPAALLRRDDDRPAFDDPELTAMASRVSPPPRLGATADANGYLADALESLPALRPLVEGRARVLAVTVTLVGAPGDAAARVEGAIAAEHGAVLARRQWEVEPGDGFRPRARPGPAGAVEAARRLEYDLALAGDDRDHLVALVYLGARADTRLTLSFGARRFTVDTAAPGENPALLDVGDGVTAAVAVQRDPGGRCETTRATVRTRAFRGSRGVVGEFRGVLHRGGAPVGFVRGVFGRGARGGRDAVHLRAIGLDGRALWTGSASGAVGAAPRIGRLRGAGGPAGTFAVRATVEPGEGRAARADVAIEMHTDCR